MNSLDPSLALLVHGSEHSNPIVLTLHAITKDATGASILDAGRLLTENEATTLGHTLIRPSVARQGDGIAFINRTLLRHDTNTLTWYRPASRITQYWRTEAGRVSFVSFLPSLIFHVQDGMLCVAAFLSQERPDENTALFHAPLGNVHDDSRVCIGNATLPTSMDPDTIGGWETVLLASNYTHVNHAHTLRGGATTEQHMAFWQGRQKRTSPPAERFLVPMKKNAQQWISDLAEVEA